MDMPSSVTKQLSSPIPPKRNPMKKVIYLTTRLEIELGTETDMNDVVNELEYDFKSTMPDAKVLDTEIVHFEWQEDFEEKN